MKKLIFFLILIGLANQMASQNVYIFPQSVEELIYKNIEIEKEDINYFLILSKNALDEYFLIISEMENEPKELNLIIKESNRFLYLEHESIGKFRLPILFETDFDFSSYLFEVNDEIKDSPIEVPLIKSTITFGGYFIRFDRRGEILETGYSR